jgi:hypothetical protein
LRVLVAWLAPLVVALDNSLENWVHGIKVCRLLLVWIAGIALPPLIPPLVSELSLRLVPSWALVSPPLGLLRLVVTPPLGLLRLIATPPLGLLRLVAAPLVVGHLSSPVVGVWLIVTTPAISLSLVISLLACASAYPQHHLPCCFSLEVELHYF